MKTTWKELIIKEMESHNEKWRDIKFIYPADNLVPTISWYDMDFQENNIDSFTIWTANRVYFPSMDSGGLHPASVCRNPCLVATRPI